jgi:DNA-binding beta-propeller fold protein YncE
MQKHPRPRPRAVRAATLIGLVCALFGAPARSQGTPKEALLVISKGDHRLAIVDPASLAVVARAPVGDDPHEVIASRDGTTAYVSNYGSGAFHSLAVIDLVGQKALPSIDLGALRGPHGLVFAGDEVWFTAEASKAVGRFDPARRAVDFILGTGQDRTHMIYVSADLKRIFTTNVSSATVSILEKSRRRGFGPPPGFGPPGSGPRGGGPPGGAAAGGGVQLRRSAPVDHPPPGGHPMGSPDGDWDATVVPVGRGAEGFDVAPNGRELWTANAQDGTISIVDLRTKKVVATLPANVPGANRLKFTPDGKRVLVSSLGGAGLVILDAATRKEVKRLDAITGAAGIQMQPDGARAYVACSRESYVAVIDLEKLTLVGKIDAGPEPDGLAWSSRR